MQLISKHEKGIQFLLSFAVFSKHAWVVPLENKKIILIVNTFYKVLDKSERCKLNKIWVDKVVNFMIDQ